MSRQREEQMMNSARLAELNSRTVDLSKKEVFMSAYIQGWKDADSHPHWIPVEERLPDEISEIHHCSTDVLIGYFANGDNYQTTARYNCKEKVWYDADDWGEIDFPTHWMPLPAAPKKGGQKLWQ